MLARLELALSTSCDLIFLLEANIVAYTYLVTHLELGLPTNFELLTQATAMQDSVLDNPILPGSLKLRIISDKSHAPYWVNVALAPALDDIRLALPWHPKVTSSAQAAH